MTRLAGLRLFLVLWLLAVAGGQAWAHQVEPLAPDRYKWLERS